MPPVGCYCKGAPADDGPRTPRPDDYAYHLRATIEAVPAGDAIERGDTLFPEFGDTRGPTEIVSASMGNHRPSALRISKHEEVSTARSRTSGWRNCDMARSNRLFELIHQRRTCHAGAFNEHSARTRKYFEAIRS